MVEQKGCCPGQLGDSAPHLLLSEKMQVRAAKEVPAQRRKSGWPTGPGSEPRRCLPARRGPDSNRQEAPPPKLAGGTNSSEKHTGRVPYVNGKVKRADAQAAPGFWDIPGLGSSVQVNENDQIFQTMKGA